MALSIEPFSKPRPPVLGDSLSPPPPPDPQSPVTMASESLGDGHRVPPRSKMADMIRCSGCFADGLPRAATGPSGITAARSEPSDRVPLRIKGLCAAPARPFARGHAQ